MNGLNGDIKDLEEGRTIETLMTNHNGGIMDILLVSKLSGGRLHIVGNNHKVKTEIQNLLKNFEGDTTIEIPEHYYFTFQGPKSKNFLKPGILQYMSNNETECINNYFRNCLVVRWSNTGEDGYTIWSSNAFAIQDDLERFSFGRNIPFIDHVTKECLRIEAGNVSESDFDENTSPVEAGLTHFISERKKLYGGYPGAERILNELRNGPRKKRRGFISNEGRIRRGDEVRSPTGQIIGQVTSGTYSPILKGFIAMGYVDTTYSSTNEDLVFNGGIKGRFYKLPFVPHQFSTNRTPDQPLIA